MSNKGSVQDGYLKAAAKEDRLLRVNLINGKEVRGTVENFDAFTLLMSVKGAHVLVYKSAIAAIGPGGSTQQEG